MNIMPRLPPSQPYSTDGLAQHMGGGVAGMSNNNNNNNGSSNRLGSTAPIAIARPPDSDGEDEDSEQTELSRSIHHREFGTSLGRSLPMAMAYSLSEAQSMQRHEEMLLRTMAGRAAHQSQKANSSISGSAIAQSLPAPHAPFLSSTRKDLDRRLSSIPAMSLPDSVAAESSDSGGTSVPFGSLRNSHFQTRFQESNRTQTSSTPPAFQSLGNGSGVIRDGASPSSFRSDCGIGALVGQQRSKCSDECKRQTSEGSSCSNEEILGSSLTALGVMEFTRRSRIQGAVAAQSLQSEQQVVGALQQLAARSFQESSTLMGQGRTSSSAVPPTARLSASMDNGHRSDWKLSRSFRNGNDRMEEILESSCSSSPHQPNGSLVKTCGRGGVASTSPSQLSGMFAGKVAISDEPASEQPLPFEGNLPTPASQDNDADPDTFEAFDFEFDE